jgi:hypothetical protein
MHSELSWSSTRVVHSVHAKVVGAPSPFGALPAPPADGVGNSVVVCARLPA